MRTVRYDDAETVMLFWADALRVHGTAFVTSTDMTIAFNRFRASRDEPPWDPRRLVPAASIMCRSMHMGEYRMLRATPRTWVRSTLSGELVRPDGRQVRAWWGVQFKRPCLTPST